MPAVLARLIPVCALMVLLSTYACAERTRGYQGYLERFTVSVNDSDRHCNESFDCRRIETNCSGCGCGVAAVHESVQDKYRKDLRAFCEDYRGGVCDSQCSKSVPFCRNNLCELAEPRDRLPVDSEDQACGEDGDCARIGMSCGDCDCGGAVNREQVAKYVELRQSICAGPEGRMCEMDCPPTRPVCQEGRCVLLPVPRQGEAGS